MRYVIFFLLLTIIPCYAKHCQPEKYYQHLWCTEQNGIEEYKLCDKTRVDCLTEEYAIEFDWAKKWAECVGQCLYYAKLTGKKPAAAIIIDSKNDKKYIERIKTIDKEIKIFEIKSLNYK